MEQIINLLTKGVSDKAAATVEIIFMLTVSFIIGAAMIWFYHKIQKMILNRKIDELNEDLLLYQDECKRYKSEKDKINFSYKLLTEDNNKLMVEYKLLKKENEKLKEQIQTERQKPMMSIGHHKEEIKRLNAINEKLENEAKDLNKQIQKLKNDNDYVKDQERKIREDIIEEKQKYIEEVRSTKHDFQMEKQRYSGELKEARQNLQKLRVEREKVVKELDLALLNNQILKSENEKIKFQSNQKIIETGRKKLEAKEDEFEKKKRLLLDSIGKASISEKEDLKQIRGIGPFIEKKLHQIGVYTIKQVANFKKEDITRATDLIKYFPGRIERDEWVFQAKELMRVMDKNLELIKKFE
ncbi:MAG: hypothetical protein NTY22_01135 [Proteobacteria bacterium]|nr:hypothetical protein [Pseudomonadota bacterium]